MTSIFECAGGQEAPRHVVDVLSGGGPDDFTTAIGFAHLIDVHRGLKITEAQRQRFVELYLVAIDTAGLPDDAPFREALRLHVEFDSQVATQNHRPAPERLRLCL